jgi:hypothetical protein
MRKMRNRNGKTISNCIHRNSVLMVAYVASCELLVLETAKWRELGWCSGGALRGIKGVLAGNSIVTDRKSRPQIKFP